MNIERIILFVLITCISLLVITSWNHLTVNPLCSSDNVSISRRNVVPLGQDDEDAFVFVHVSKCKKIICSAFFFIPPHLCDVGNLDLDF